MRFYVEIVTAICQKILDPGVNIIPAMQDTFRNMLTDCGDPGVQIVGRQHRFVEFDGFECH